MCEEEECWEISVRARTNLYLLSESTGYLSSLDLTLLQLEPCSLFGQILGKQSTNGTSDRSGDLRS